MSPSAARACRADRRVAGLPSGVPRTLKATWSRLTQRERAKLTRRWRLAQAERRALGDFKHQEHLKALREKTP